MDEKTRRAENRGWEKLESSQVVRIALYGAKESRAKALKELERRIELEQKSARR